MWSGLSTTMSTLWGHCVSILAMVSCRMIKLIKGVHYHVVKYDEWYIQSSLIDQALWGLKDSIFWGIAHIVTISEKYIDRPNIFWSVQDHEHIQEPTVGMGNNCLGFRFHPNINDLNRCLSVGLTTALCNLCHQHCPYFTINRKCNNLGIQIIYFHRRPHIPKTHRKAVSVPCSRNEFWNLVKHRTM